MIEIIDLSHPLEPNTPVFSDYPSFDFSSLDRAANSTPKERHLNSSRVAFGLHCGTHMDAPYHFFDGKESIADVPLDCCIGPCVLIDLERKLADGEIRVEHLQPYADAIRAGGKVIL